MSEKENINEDVAPRGCLVATTIFAGIIVFIVVAALDIDWRLGSQGNFKNIYLLYALFGAIITLVLYPVLGKIAALILEKMSKFAKILGNDEYFPERPKIIIAIAYPVIFPIAMICLFCIGVVNRVFKLK